MCRTFRFTKPQEMLGSEEIVTALGESYIQSFAKANFGRELSDIELNRFSDEVWDNENAVEGLAHLIRAEIETIIN